MLREISLKKELWRKNDCVLFWDSLEGDYINLDFQAIDRRMGVYERWS
jgi:hypothetical protein